MSSEGDAVTAKPTEAATELHSDVKDEMRQRQATPGEDRHAAAETDDTKSDGGGEEDAPGGKVTHLDDDLEPHGGKTTHIDDVEVEAPGEKAAHIDGNQRRAGSADNHSQIYDLFAITVCGEHTYSHGSVQQNVMLLLYHYFYGLFCH